MLPAAATSKMVSVSSCLLSLQPAQHLGHLACCAVHRLSAHMEPAAAAVTDPTVACLTFLLTTVDHKQRIETISWSPRAFIYHNFLSPEEVEHMLSLVEKQVRLRFVCWCLSGGWQRLRGVGA